MQVRAFIPALLFVCFAAVPPVPSQDEFVRWLGDYNEALAEAKRTNKPIFLEYRCEP